MPVSGSINTHYNDKGLPSGPDRLSQRVSALVFRRMWMQRVMNAWIVIGQVKC